MKHNTCDLAYLIIKHPLSVSVFLLDPCILANWYLLKRFFKVPISY